MLIISTTKFTHDDSVHPDGLQRPPGPLLVEQGPEEGEGNVDDENVEHVLDVPDDLVLSKTLEFFTSRNFV